MGHKKDKELKAQPVCLSLPPNLVTELRNKKISPSSFFRQAWNAHQNKLWEYNQEL